ncbi:MAG: 3-deoxy-D-manno-octulosonic acid transferase [Bacteroidales bacterium]|nr:3-deoxy-D-manno-octulosonic acid transferase [Bacteroidales bacterium]
MRLLYSLAISSYAIAVRLASPFNTKASLLRDGWCRWKDKIPIDKLAKERVAWFHVASLGEFEQARPVMESFRKLHPDYKICLSFFSPSGYEVRKDYNGADVVMYLPPDTRHNAKALVETIHPDIAFFVKYEFWFNYLHELQSRNVPTYIFSAIFRKNQYFFRWYGRWFSRQLQCYKHMFVQNEESMDLLKSIGITHCSIAGDTRFDRVNDIAAQAKRFPEIERFIANGGDYVNGTTKTLMVGSSWEPDEANIEHFITNYTSPIKIIVAPHMIDERHLKKIESLFGHNNCVRYSRLKTENEASEYYRCKILIIDNIGMLSSLYRYATVSYIGGGFGKGIHNILEAAVFNCPVCFGPNHKKFDEAVKLLQQGGAQTYDTPDQLAKILTEWFDNKELYNKASTSCRDFMQQNLGATATIINKVESDHE